MAKKIFLIAFIFVCYKLQAQPVIYSVQAHQDDWQLFMSSKIITDLTAGSKVVFITLTAGDGGCGNCSYTPSREIGSVYSSKFAVDLTNTATAPTDVPVATTVSINSHNITKYVYKNSVNYFLRLPDGSGNGAGFPSTGNQSLQRLKNNNISSITAVDNSAVYTSWADLTNTIKAIINTEKITGRQGWIYSASLNTTNNSNPPNPTYNINDHSDHYYSAMAARDAVSAAPEAWVGINEFVDYYSSALPANLSSTAYENASIIFAHGALGITLAEYRNEFTVDHQIWLPMDYYGTFRNPSGFAL